jgi:hypothetical protein
MYVRVESGLGATAPVPAKTSSDSSPWGGIIGGIFSGAGTVVSGFLTADAQEYVARQQTKSDMFSAMAQQNVGIEQVQASERIAAAEQKAAIQQTAIITQALTTGIVAAAVVGGIWIVARVLTEK